MEKIPPTKAALLQHSKHMQHIELVKWQNKTGLVSRVLELELHGTRKFVKYESTDSHHTGECSVAGKFFADYRHGCASVKFH